MSFIQTPLAESVDTFRAGDLLNNAQVTTEQQDAAWATLRRHGALELAPMLGLAEVTR